MFDGVSEALIAAVIGGLGGIMLGLAARLGRFCTLGAIEDMLYGGSNLRMRMWILAIGVAITGTFGLIAAGMMDPLSTYYLSIKWLPLASIIGGLMFGYGMALAGNCGFGAIARLGGGDLRSFVIVLVMGISTYVVLSGPLAPLRVWIFPQEVPSAPVPAGLAHQVGAITGIPVSTVGILAGLCIAIAALGGGLWREAKSVFWSVAVGLAVVIGWAGTAWLARGGYDQLPVVSHSFSAPLGETILYMMTGSGQHLSFAVGSVSGVWTGAFLGSLIKGHFRWEACEDPRELRRQIFGAGLMGAGAVIALGCTIGQGLTAFSVLSLSAPVTFLAIIAGAALGLRQLIEGFQPAE